MLCTSESCSLESKLSGAGDEVFIAMPGDSGGKSASKILYDLANRSLRKKLDCKLVLHKFMPNV